MSSEVITLQGVKDLQSEAGRLLGKQWDELVEFENILKIKRELSANTQVESELTYLIGKLTDVRTALIDTSHELAARVAHPLRAAT